METHELFFKSLTAEEEQLRKQRVLIGFLKGGRQNFVFTITDQLYNFDKTF